MTAHSFIEAVNSVIGIQSIPTVGIFRLRVIALTLTLFQLILAHWLSHHVFSWKFHKKD